MDERIDLNSSNDLRIKFKTVQTAKLVESIIKSNLFTGRKKYKYKK